MTNILFIIFGSILLFYHFSVLYRSSEWERNQRLNNLSLRNGYIIVFLCIISFLLGGLMVALGIDNIKGL
jgi:hypothetical protein